MWLGLIGVALAGSGHVVIDGQSVPFAHVHSAAGDVWTGPDGSYRIDGDATAEAWLRDGVGEVHLASAEGAGDLALTKIEVDGRPRDLDAARATAIAHGETADPAVLAEIAEVVDELGAARDAAARRKLASRHVTALATADGVWLDRAVGARQSAADHRGDIAGYVTWGEVIVDAGGVIGRPELVASGQMFVAVGHAGEPGSAELVDHSVATLSALVDADPAHRGLLLPRLAQALFATTIVDSMTHDWNAAYAAALRAIPLATELGRPGDALALELQASGLARLAATPEDAVDHAVRAITLAVAVDDPASLAAAKQAKADALDGSADAAAVIAALDDAGDAWDAAGDVIHAATTRNQADAARVRDGSPPTSASVVVGELEALPASPERDHALADASRHLGQSQTTDDGCTGEPALMRALELDTARGSPMDVALDQQALGNCVWARGEAAEAARWFSTAAGSLDADPQLSSAAAFLWKQAGSAFGDATPPQVADALAAYDHAIADARAARDDSTLAEALSGYTVTAMDDVHQPPDAILALAARSDEALRLFTAAGRPSDARDEAAVLRSLLSYAGVMLVQSGRIDEGTLTLVRALELAESDGDDGAVGDAHGSLALACEAAGRFADAAAHQEHQVAWLMTDAAAAQWKEQQALIAANGGAGGMASIEQQREAALGLLAVLYWNAGDPKHALDAESRHRAYIEAHGTSASWMLSAETEAGWRLELGDIPAFEALVAKVRSDAKTDDDRAIVWPLLLARALVQGDRAGLASTTADAVRWLDARRAVAEALPEGQRTGFVAAWTLIGMLGSRTGQPALALPGLEEAAKLAPATQRSLLYGELGRVHRELGHLEAALDAQRKAIGVADLLGGYLKPAEQLALLLDALDTETALGDRDGIAATTARVDALVAAVNAQPVVTDTDRRTLGAYEAIRGRTAASEGRWADAADAFDRALADYGSWRDDRAIADEVAALDARIRAGRASSPAADWRRLVDAAVAKPAPHALVALVDVAATAKLGSADLTSLERTLAAAIPDAAARGDHHAGAALVGARARTLVALGRGDEAVAVYADALDRMDVLRGSLRSDTAKIGLGDAESARLYDEDVALLVARGRPAEGLAISERGRARAFQDLLASSEVPLATPTAAEARALLDQLAAPSGQVSLSALLPGVGTATVTDALGVPETVGSLKPATLPPVDGDPLMARFRAIQDAATDEVTSTVVARTPSPDELLRIAAATGATVVEYHVSAASTVAFVVSGGAVRVVPVAQGRDELDRAVLAMRADLGVDAARGVRVAAAHAVAAADPNALPNLGAALIAPLNLPDGPVLFVPDGPLFLVPFAALPEGSGVVADHHAVTIAPALGVLAFTDARKARASASGALVVGNPAMPTLPGYVLPALPGAETEAKAVAATLNVAVLTGSKADEATVTARLPGVRTVHLATHGLVDDADPLASFVALASGNGADGRLTVAEVFGLHLTADLVTLSACQTGLGRVSGDGVMGLGRAFLFAGTPDVLVSLWSVSDAATAFEMQAFYAALAQGQPKSEALRTAELATKAKYPDPASWAAFVLVGSP
jgi:tetratricopeptide (TPR) repeat protein